MWDRLLSHLQIDAVDPYGLLLDVGILLVAFVIALPVGWDRERSTRSMGLRTFPLVSVASAGFVLISKQVIGVGGPETARVLQGLMTGIGFLGGGAILKDEDRVRGSATAASVWGTAGIGAAVAFGRLEIALVLSGLSFAVLRFLRPVKELASEGAEADEATGDAEART